MTKRHRQCPRPISLDCDCEELRAGFLILVLWRSAASAIIVSNNDFTWLVAVEFEIVQQRSVWILASSATRECSVVTYVSSANLHSQFPGVVALRFRADIT